MSKQVFSLEFLDGKTLIRTGENLAKQGKWFCFGEI